MSNFAQNLRALPEESKLFDRAWDIVKECGEEERHFNQLQSVYRGVASTWLLATLGAVGYVLGNKEATPWQYPLHPYWVVAIVFLLGAFGISLIGVLDLRVYHRLLVSVFDEGLRLEEEFAWLPRYRTNMASIGVKTGTRTHQGHDAVRRDLAKYYLGTVFVPLAGCIVFVSIRLRNLGCPWYRYAIFLSMAAAALLIVFYIWTSGVRLRWPWAK